MKNILEGPIDIDGTSYMMVHSLEHDGDEYKSDPLSCCDRCAFDYNDRCAARCCDEETKCSFFARYEKGEADNC